MSKHRYPENAPCARRASARTFGWLLALATTGALAGAQPAAQPVAPAAFGDLAWRAIGPAAMGGRVADVAGVAGHPTMIFVAAASGGLFKSTNAGTTFQPIFEDQPVLSIGAIAVDPSNPNVIYVGTGEGNPRNTASFGNGVYKTTDGGKSWTHLGLEGTERIARIRLHPTDPAVVYVAALGHEWAADPDRGVFRSVDGGRTWKKLLYVNDTTGAADVAIDPADPRIVYAGMYDFLRRAWHLRSGGPGSGLYRSSDGGETWQNLSAGAPQNGLPEGVVGRIGVDVAQSDPDVVYAMIEAKAGKLWRSADRGRTWRMASDRSDLISRGFYFSDVRVDPANANRVYAISGGLLVSDDAGATWKRIAQGTHGDYQAMWIDPKNTRRLIIGNDGGAYVSHDQGETFEFLDTLPLAQAYHVQVDMRDPYHVCGGLQDNGVWCGPNEKWNLVGTENRDWSRVHFGDGFYAEIDPRDWRTIYTNAHAGNIVLVNGETGEKRWIQPYPVSLTGSAAGDHPYRFNWNSAIHMSPHDPNVVYFGSNVLFRTADRGDSWEAISPDLTTNDPEKQKPSGGPIAFDNTSAEYHCTIIAISESPVQKDVIWVGTDDGHVQVTRDGGRTWTNVIKNIPGVPPNSWVPHVDASNHAAGTAYVVFDRHRDNDFRPYAYRTDDFGSTWTNITANLPPIGYAHVIKDDPRSANLLYAGTELGIFASFDRGGNWANLRLKLPPVAVTDLVVHPRDNDLVIATHGRGFFVLDDVAPLQELSHAIAEGVFLFPPPTATRVEAWDDYRYSGGQRVFSGQNAPRGALISYYIGHDAAHDVSVVILDGSRRPIRQLKPQARPGVNRIVWDLREAPVASPAGAEREGGEESRRPIRAPKVLPGMYTVRLTAGGREFTRPLEVRIDPRITVSAADLTAQHDAVRQLVEMASRGARALERIIAVEKRLRAGSTTGSDTARAAAEKKLAQLAQLKGRLKADPGGYKSPAQLLEKIATLLSAIDSATGRPTAAEQEWIGRFRVELDEALSRIEPLLAGESTGPAR